MMILYGQHLLLLSIESSPSADATSTTATKTTAKSMLYTESAEEVRLPIGLTHPDLLTISLHARIPDAHQQSSFYSAETDAYR